jgi:tetratricopeptide (TPR) repeat protein
MAAAEHLGAALAAAPAPPQHWLRQALAETLREQGRVEEAEAVYRALLCDEPGSWQGLVGLGRCARLRNDRVSAVAHFIAATEAAPDADAAWFELAWEYRDAGRFDEARAILRPLVHRGSAAAQIWLGLGFVERSAGDRAAALQAFREGYARHPERHEFMIEIGIEEQALGRHAEAERWLLRASEIDALAGAALTRLAEMWRFGQHLEKALSLFRRAVALPGVTAWAYASLAQTLSDLGRTDEAFGVLETAEQRAGCLPDIALKRASLLRRAGFRHEALAAVRDAVAAAPTHFPLWFEWFENERFCGDAAGLDRCLAAAPAATVRERAHVHHARGLLAVQHWQLEAAVAEFRAAIALDASLSPIHGALARVSLLRFDIATARKHLSIMQRLLAPSLRWRGLSSHLTHTLIGQILEEFLMDKAASDAAAEALSAASGRRIERLLALVRAVPGHTPTAIALLLALRQAGGFAAIAGETGRAGIPATGIPPAIVQYWNDAALPQDVGTLMRSWRECNPAYHYARFDDDSAQAFLKARCAPEVLCAYLRARTPVMRADLFRLAFLFAEGGFYADADDRCLRPLGELVPPRANLVAFQEDLGTLGNNFLAAAPLHPVLGLALQQAVEAINRGDDDLVWLSTGPGLFTRAFAQTLAASALSPCVWLERTVILDRAVLERAIATHCATVYKNSRQHWHRAAFG